MPINWFTVVAQAINFLILVWLLRRFLYKPILDAIDARECGIAAQVAEAEVKKAEAQKDRDDFQHKNEAFDLERSALVKKATDEAKAASQRLTDEARKQADSLRNQRQEALQNEQRNLSQEIAHWTQKQVFLIARKTLTDLADTNVENRMVELFVQRLRAFSGSAKEQMSAALGSAPRQVRLRSAFDLPPALRGAIENAVKETFAVETQIEFETAADLIGGAELSVNGLKVAWSIADYLSTLEKSASALLRKDIEPEPKPEPKAVAQPTPNAVLEPEVTHEPKNGHRPAAWSAKVIH